MKTIRKTLKPLIVTPLHPQWLLSKHKYKLIDIISSVQSGSTVLDIGCFDKWTKSYLPATCTYMGLDYLQTSNEWYQSCPDVYGDALSLPIKSSSIDVVLLCDVLEHLEDSTQVIQEIYRVLRPSGKLIMSVPFLYPLHDEPRDFVRYTKYGLKKLANKNRFNVASLESLGHPVVTGTLIMNLGMAKTVINLFASRNPVFILGLLLLIIMPFANILAWLLSLVSPSDEFMPSGYLVVFDKN